jgi:hypothetical protein
MRCSLHGGRKTKLYSSYLSPVNRVFLPELQRGIDAEMTDVRTGRP